MCEIYWSTCIPFPSAQNLMRAYNEGLQAGIRYQNKGMAAAVMLLDHQTSSSSFHLAHGWVRRFNVRLELQRVYVN